MRITRLATIALQAERLRLQRKLKIIVGRVVIAAVAAVLISLCLVFLHLAAYDALLLSFAPYWAALIVAGADTALALLFLIVALRTPFDPAQNDAKQVRDDAVRQLRNTMALTAAAGPVTRILGKKAALGVGAATLLAQLMGRR